MHAQTEHNGGGVERVVTGIEENALAQFSVYSRKWFPGRNITTRSMGEALFLEKDFWQKQGKAIANGIAMAFKG